MRGVREVCDDLVPALVPDPVPVRWGRAEASAVVAGWGIAVAVLLPPMVEGVDGRAAAALALGGALAFWVLAVVIVRSDLLHFIIPDEASAALAALGLATAAGTPWLSGGDGADISFAILDSAATGAGAFALFWAIGAAFRAAGRDALGHGDVKLAGALGLWLSPSDAAFALELAALGAMATLLAPPLSGARRATLCETAVPFGAFMAPAAWLVLVLAPVLRDAGWLPW